VRFLVNHQSCEGSHHGERHAYITGLGLENYHDAACREIGLEPASVALMGTAANMNYAAMRELSDGEVTATAVVTAGVQGNAACAGDPATWRETDAGWEQAPAYAGTINTMLLVNRPLTEGALARAAVTITEGKAAALHQLAVKSLYSQDHATGTGTDQYAIAAPLAGARPLSNTGPHAKLGELIGVAVREATREALRWQNGLEASHTRSIFHALGKYGLNEDRLMEDIAPLLAERELELLKKNSKSVFYEPMVAAGAYAIATILDRLRYGTLPASVAREALRQQAAMLAANLAAQPQRSMEFCACLDEADPERPERLILAALALGWSSKWQ
jgi:adenosylcobinamide amidohydrolase